MRVQLLVLPTIYCHDFREETGASTDISVLALLIVMQAHHIAIVALNLYCRMLQTHRVSKERYCQATASAPNSGDAADLGGSGA